MNAYYFFSMNVNEAMLTGNADSDPSDPDADLNAT